MTQHNEDKSGGHGATRRTVLKMGLAVSAAAVGVSATNPGMAQSEMDLTLDINAEAETVTITNNGDSSVDLTDYQMNFEAGEDSEVDQIRTLAGEVIVEADESVTVATGAGEEGDVSLEDPYDGEVLNNEESDVVALLSPDGTIVATSDGSDDDDEEDDETHTLTATIVESGDADVVSGEVTVDGQTKTTTPESDEDSHVITADFELKDGTYTVAATYDAPNETWESNKQEVEIDGGDETVSLTVYPPDSDELEDDDGSDSDEDDETDEADDSDDDCPEEDPEPEEKEDDCPEEEPEPEEDDCPEE